MRCWKWVYKREPRPLWEQDTEPLKFYSWKMNLGLRGRYNFSIQPVWSMFISSTKLPIKSKILGKPLDCLTLLLEYSCSGGAVIASNPCSLPRKIFSACLPAFLVPVPSACMTSLLCSLWRGVWLFSITPLCQQWLFRVLEVELLSPYLDAVFSVWQHLPQMFLVLAPQQLAVCWNIRPLENTLGLLKQLFTPGPS